MGQYRVGSQIETNAGLAVFIRLSRWNINTRIHLRCYVSDPNILSTAENYPNDAHIERKAGLFAIAKVFRFYRAEGSTNVCFCDASNIYICNPIL